MKRQNTMMNLQSGLDMMEPKQEPEEERLTESPLIRVCDTPSPTSTHSSHSPPPSSIVAPMLPIFPPMMFLNPYLSLPLQRFPQLPLPPLLPPSLQQNNETKPKSMLPFSIDNILKSVPRLASPSQLPRSPPVKTGSEGGPSPAPETPRRSLSRSPEQAESPVNTPPGVTKDADCPPGMVRGPNGKLVPAWVFCTRYCSPGSSQNFINILFLKGTLTVPPAAPGPGRSRRSRRTSLVRTRGPGLPSPLTNSTG